MWYTWGSGKSRPHSFQQKLCPRAKSSRLSCGLRPGYRNKTCVPDPPAWPTMAFLPLGLIKISCVWVVSHTSNYNRVNYGKDTYSRLSRPDSALSHNVNYALVKPKGGTSGPRPCVTF